MGNHGWRHFQQSTGIENHQNPKQNFYQPPVQVLRVPLMLAIAGEAWRKSHELLPRSLANLAWSFASCAMYHQPLIDLISCRAIKLKQEFTS